MDMRKVEQRWRFARVIVRLSITKLSTLMRGPPYVFQAPPNALDAIILYFKIRLDC